MKYIDINSPFLPSLSQYILKEHGSELPDLSSVLMVFPTGRSGLYFRRLLLQKSGSEAMFPPAIEDINSFISSLYMEHGEKLEAGKLRRLLILKEAVGMVKDEASGLFRGREGELLRNFIDFAGYGMKLLRFFDELKEEAVSFELLSRRGLYTDYEGHIQVLKKIYDFYNILLAKDGLIDRPEMLNFAVENFNPAWLSSYKKIYFCGFFALTQLQTGLLKKVIESGKGELILHTDLGELKKNSGESVFIHHRHIIDSLYPDGWNVNDLIDGERPERFIEPQVKCLRNDIEQVSFILESISEACKANIKPNRIAVIMPDENLSRLLVEALDNRNIKYNLTVGYPLRETALYSFFSILSDFISGGFYYRDFISLLSHPFIKGGNFNGISGQEIVYPVMETIRKRNYVYIDVEGMEFKNDCDIYASKRGGGANAVEGLLRFISEIKSKFNAVNTIEELAGYFTSLIKNIFFIYGSDGRAQHPFFRESIEKTEESIGEILSVSPFIRTFSNADEKTGFVRLFLKDLAERHITVTAGSPFKGVQIMGVIESMNLDFDAIIMPSMNEGVFPASSSKDLFLNTVIRDEVGLPTYRERESLYGLYFKSAVSSARGVFISYLREEEESKNLPSRFIEKEKFRTGVLGMNEPDQQFNFFFNLSEIKRKNLPEREIRKTPQIMRVMLETAITQGVLKDYIECPYRFYLRRVLRIKERDAVSEEFEGLKIGTIVHSAIRDFVKEMYRIENLKLDVDDLWKIFENKLNDAFIKEHPSGFDEILGFRALKESLSYFLDNEITRRDEGWRTEGKYLEMKCETLFNLGDGRNVKLAGTIDRIDVKDDRFLIIDYKTGKTPTSANIFKFEKNPSELQLPLYTFIFSDKNSIHLSAIAGMAYYDLKESFDLKLILSRDNVKDKMDDKMEGFINYLRGKLGEMFDEERPFVHTTDYSNCEYCPFPSVCRIEEINRRNSKAGE